MIDSRDPPDVLGSITRGEETSLVDVIDSLLNRGLMLDGDLVLGLAGVDLIYLRLSTLLATADRVLPHARRPPTDSTERDREPASSSVSATPAPSATPSVGAPVEPPAERVGPREHVHAVEPEELDAVSDELARRPEQERPARFDPDPDEVRRSVMKLVLTLVELIRDILERQALRRMESETLTDDEVENLGRALMQLEETVHELAARFDIDPDELNLDLGPLGKLR